jgi:hypothetical protein
MSNRLSQQVRAYRVPLRRYRSRLRELVHDPAQPMRTAFGFSLGAWLGATPILGVHTWMAVTSALLLRLPPLAVVLGSNLSNPITFIPLTILEVRIGAMLRGNSFSAIPREFDAASLGGYVLEAWLGWLIVGTLMAVLSFTVVRLVQHLSN